MKKDKKVVEVCSTADNGISIKYRVFNGSIRTDFLSKHEAVAWATFTVNDNVSDRPVYITEVTEKSLFIVQKNAS